MVNSFLIYKFTLKVLYYLNMFILYVSTSMKSLLIQSRKVGLLPGDEIKYTRFLALVKETIKVQMS